MPRVGLNLLGVFVARLGHLGGEVSVLVSGLPMLPVSGTGTVYDCCPRSREVMVGSAHYLICPNLPIWPGMHDGLGSLGCSAIQQAGHYNGP